MSQGSDTINEEYQNPRSYGTEESYYGNGKYPPDWDQRCDVVWEKQNHQCGRCGAYRGDVQTAEVHHMYPLQYNGSNAVDNLVGLCCHCHAAMHPNNPELNGEVSEAPIFPDESADPRVAVIREPSADRALYTDVLHLSNTSNTDRNSTAYEFSDAAVSTSSDVARRAEANLDAILNDHGYVSRTSEFHTVEIDPVYTGVRGVISGETPDIETVTDGSCVEQTGWTDTVCPVQEILYTEDASATKIRLTSAAGDTETVPIQFPTDGSHVRISPQMEPRPLTVRSLFRYVFDAGKFILPSGIKYGFAIWLLLAVVVGGYIQPLRTTAGLGFIIILCGVLIHLSEIRESVFG